MGLAELTRISEVGDVLEFARGDLLAKGFIDQPMLTWCGRHSGFGKFEQTLIGIKNGELMVLPMINIQTFEYDKVEYYKKGEATVKITHLPQLKVKSKGGSDVFNIYGVSNGVENLRNIVSIYNSS